MSGQTVSGFPTLSEKKVFVLSNLYFKIKWLITQFDELNEITYMSKLTHKLKVFADISV